MVECGIGIKVGNYEDEMCTMTVIELDNIAIDSQIGLDGWKIYITLREENIDVTGRKNKIIDILNKNSVEILNNNGNKLQIGSFDYYSDYEQIAERVITILKLFQ